LKEKIVVKKMAAAVVLCACVGWLSGCMSVASPTMGIILTDVAWDGDAEGGLGAKEGKSCAKAILGLVANGDASIKAAAKAGGISNVTRVDHYTNNFLGILGEYCTIVGGN
jgi:hypothetical protein